MKIKLLLGGLSALVAVGTISQTAHAQSSVGSTNPNTGAVLTIDRGTGTPLESTTTDPLALRGMASHTGTPTEVLVMEGELVRSYPISSIAAGGGSDSLVANPDGSYTHTAADGTVVTIAATASDSLADNGDGTFTHTDTAGNQVSFNGMSPVGVWRDANDLTRADLNDKSILLPPDPANLNPHVFMHLLGVQSAGEIGTVVGATNDGSYIGTNNNSFKFQIAASTSDPELDTFEMKGDGSLQAHQYGAGTFDDAAPARLLGVSANGGVVEVNPASVSGGSDDLMDNGDGTFTHTDTAGNEVTFNGAAPLEPWMDADNPTEQADIGDAKLLLPSNSGGFTNVFLGGNTSAAENGMRFLHINSGSAAGGYLDFAGGPLRIRTNVTGSGSTGAIDEVMYFFETGRIRIGEYGNGAFTGTTAYMLGVDSNGNIIELDPATVGGSGTTSSLTQNPDGTYTHSDGEATPTTTTFDASNAWHPVSDTTASAVGSTAEDIIFDAGQVGIGVTPSEQLHVAGNALLTGNLYTNSDSRLKTNIVEFEGSLASVMNIEPVTFDWIDEDAHTSGTQLGFIAQDVQAALPEAVIVSEDELGTLSVADRPILAASIGAIQELKAENDALKAELEDMKSQMQQMELLQLAVMSMQAQLADMAQADAVMKANFSL